MDWLRSEDLKEERGEGGNQPHLLL
jgi:hypothetical protein